MFLLVPHLRQLKRGGNGWMREPPCESLLAFYAWAPLSRMGRMDLNRVLGCLSLPNYSCCSTCMCMSTLEDEDGFERKALMASDEMMKLREIFEGNKTLAFHLEPKTVVLRVSMHCHGCAKKVGKHISKMEGVTSFEVDLESKKVVVMGDITPFEVLESVSKVKSAELWIAP